MLDDYEQRVRALKDRLPAPAPPVTMDEALRRAEECADKGWHDAARSWLRVAEGKKLDIEDGLDEEDEAPDSWEEFIEEHPELDDLENSGRSDPPILEPPGRRREEVVLNVDVLSDDELVAAVRRIGDRRRARFPNHPRSWGVMAADVAWDLAGHKVDLGSKIKVGQRLGQLARAGRLLPANKPYDGRSYLTAEGGA